VNFGNLGVELAETADFELCLTGEEVLAARVSSSLAIGRKSPGELRCVSCSQRPQRIQCSN